MSRRGHGFTRLLRMLVLLLDRSWTSQEIAERLGVTKRTVLRSINCLEEAGIVVDRDDSDHGYSPALFRVHSAHLNPRLRTLVRELSA